jgi:hypothetical protein
MKEKKANWHICVGGREVCVLTIKEKMMNKKAATKCRKLRSSHFDCNGFSK